MQVQSANIQYDPPQNQEDSGAINGIYYISTNMHLLSLSRAKPEETMVEAHSDPDMRFCRQTWA